MKDILWLTPDGREMTDEEWNQEHARTLGVFLSGSALDEMDERGQLVKDENFVLLINAHHEEVLFSLPTVAPNKSWVLLIDTSRSVPRRSVMLDGENKVSYSVQARSLALFVANQRHDIRQDRRHEA